ncbi:hypothetical protein GDO81_007154 [Engystomops pustulosus]|uniref:Uncharacterized protein n=1 Tax=Engystomops pustulosus TaxID=76066 RepID=A0AAV7C6S1_ENGPU|nr:hypothetical protein GDO81_007154 [Engystomops pustulosus]
MMKDQGLQTNLIQSVELSKCEEKDKRESLIEIPLHPVTDKILHQRGLPYTGNSNHHHHMWHRCGLLAPIEKLVRENVFFN